MRQSEGVRANARDWDKKICWTFGIMALRIWLLDVAVWGGSVERLSKCLCEKGEEEAIKAYAVVGFIYHGVFI